MSDEIDDERAVALQSLSNAQLIQILQFHDGDDALTQMVEAELSRRKTEASDDDEQGYGTAPAQIFNDLEPAHCWLGVQKWC
jgi:hypothetical protein